MSSLYLVGLILCWFLIPSAKKIYGEASRGVHLSLFWWVSLWDKKRLCHGQECLGELSSGGLGSRIPKVPHPGLPWHLPGQSIPIFNHLFHKKFLLMSNLTLPSRVVTAVHKPFFWWAHPSSLCTNVAPGTKGCCSSSNSFFSQFAAAPESHEVQRHCHFTPPFWSPLWKPGHWISLLLTSNDSKPPKGVDFVGFFLLSPLNSPNKTRGQEGNKFIWAEFIESCAQLCCKQSLMLPGESSGSRAAFPALLAIINHSDCTKSCLEAERHL